MADSKQWVIYALYDSRSPAMIRYVGKTVDLKTRLVGHICYARRTSKRTHLVQWLRALDSEGLRPGHRILEHGCGPGWEEAERKWIKTYRREGHNLCNATDGGEGSLGVKLTEAQRAVISAAQKGRKHSLEARARMSAARNGRGPYLTHESYVKMSKTKTGRPGSKPSPETIAKRTISMKETWARKVEDGWKPTPCSPEGRARTTAALIGHDVSAETRNKIGAANRGRVMSPEARAKMSEAKKGKPPHNKGKPGQKPSQEVRAKLSKAHKEAWVRRKAVKS